MTQTNAEQLWPATWHIALQHLLAVGVGARCRVFSSLAGELLLEAVEAAAQRLHKE
jgi:hypothetical protein